LFVGVRRIRILIALAEVAVMGIPLLTFSGLTEYAGIADFWILEILIEFLYVKF